MEIFNVISGVCSIVGLIVSLFVASKVSKMVKSNNDNKGELQCGDGNQKIAKEKAAFADNHSSATYNDYSNATINGEIERAVRGLRHRVAQSSGFREKCGIHRRN